MSATWRKVNLVCSLAGDTVQLRHQPLVPIREDLLALFDRGELTKYLTEEELPPAVGAAAVPPADTTPADQ
jgi:succinate dehydrogenase / fumarate reductase flavoprotein subunit